MDDAKLMELARQAGFTIDSNGSINDGIETAADFSEELAEFAALVAAAERERCAKVCFELSIRSDKPYFASDCARAIRAMKD